MIRENILRAYLEDDLFIEKGYLQEGEAKNIKWTSAKNTLIEVIKIAIDGESAKESFNITERKINQLLNKQS